MASDPAMAGSPSYCTSADRAELTRDGLTPGTRSMPGVASCCACRTGSTEERRGPSFAINQVRRGNGRPHARRTLCDGGPATNHCRGGIAAPRSHGVQPDVHRSHNTEVSADPATPGAPRSGLRKKLSYNEQREFEHLPGRIGEREAEQENLNKAVAHPEFYKESAEVIKQALARLEPVHGELLEFYKA